MAAFIMLPDGTDGGTNTWIASGGGACAATDVDNNNGDTQYCAEDRANHEVTFTMAAPSVAEAAIDFTQAVTVQIRMSVAYSATGGFGTPLRTYMEGSGISNGYNSHIIAIGNSYATYNGAVESYATGTTDWTYANLENLEIKLLKLFNAASRTIVKVSYLYVNVSYTAAAVGYGNNVLGVDSGDISKINGIATADISKVNGV